MFSLTRPISFSLASVLPIFPGVPFALSNVNMNNLWPFPILLPNHYTKLPTMAQGVVQLSRIPDLGVMVGDRTGRGANVNDTFFWGEGTDLQHHRS